MTPSELTALRVAIFTDPPATAFLQAGNVVGLRGYLNDASASIVWRTSVSQDEIMTNGFDWTRVDNLSVGGARVWSWMFDNAGKAFNPSKINVRAGIDQVWKGVTADLAVRAAVYVHCKRAATNAERLMGSGVGTTLVPATMSWEGEVTENDAARLIYKDNGTIWTAGG